MALGLLGRGAQDPGQVHGLQRLAPHAPISAKGSHKTSWLRKCIAVVLPHYGSQAPTPALAPEATRSVLLRRIALISVRAVVRARNSRPHLVGTSPTTRSGQLEPETATPARSTRRAHSPHQMSCEFSSDNQVDLVGFNIVHI